MMQDRGHDKLNLFFVCFQVREAMRKDAGFRVWIMFFLIVMSCTILFLDWYNSWSDIMGTVGLHEQLPSCYEWSLFCDDIEVLKYSKIYISSVLLKTFFALKYFYYFKDLGKVT